MGLERTTLVAAGMALAAISAEARVGALCMVSFADDAGKWSRERRVEVEFMTGREIREPGDQIRARIWFNAEHPALARIEAPPVGSPSFVPLHLYRLFSDAAPKYAAEDDGQRWRVRCVTPAGLWVDPKYPDAFDFIAPPPIPR